MTSPEDTATTSLSRRAADAFIGFRDGEADRMDELVELLTPLLWHTARAQRLERDTARDVVQTAWLRLVEHANRIDDPQAVLGWLVMTTRREAWRLVRDGSRTSSDGLQPDEARPATMRPDNGSDPGDAAIRNDEHRTLWRHLTALPERCRALLRVVAFSDRPDYAAVAAALQMPVGSIGPTRGRCLAKLRTALLADPTWEGHR